MILSFLIFMGFSHTITEKIYSISGHYNVFKYSMGNSMEEEPISTNADFYQNYKQLNYISHVQSYAHKPGLIKSDEAMQGVLMKGIGTDYSSIQFDSFITEGRQLVLEDSHDYSSEILISEKLAQLLKLELGDDILLYFIQNPPRVRKLRVVGLYKSGLEDIDDKVIIGDLRLIQRINNWSADQVGGFEVFLKDVKQIEEFEDQLFAEVDSNLYVEMIRDKYFQLFDWLELINRNVLIFLGLIFFVACFNMVSIILILIMERTQMIGILKANGASNTLIRKVFLINGILLVLKGLLWGNIIGLGLSALQYFFKLVPLDPENYYMEYVPIEWHWDIILLLNIAIILLVGLSIFIPTAAINRIKVVKAIKFD